MTDVLTDGVLRFRIERAGQEAESIELDLLIVTMELERLTVQHKLIDGKPTAAFALDMVKSLESLGVANCTPTIAYKIAMAADEAWGETQKKTNSTPNSPTGTESTPANSPEATSSD